MARSTIRERLEHFIDTLEDLRRYRGSVERDRFLSDRDTQRMVLHAIYDEFDNLEQFGSIASDWVESVD